MRDYRAISALMERTVHKYNQTENKQRNYGTDLTFSRAEIHTIEAIEDMEDINITRLAAYQGITKGAASQMVYKLVDKGVVKKRVSPNSDTEVRLELTEIGRKAYEGHKEFHRASNEKLFEMLREMPDELYEKMEEILHLFDEMMNEKLKGDQDEKSK
ncbi:MarR family winged helix-turn-helix transcriptional regulator [Anaerocolumna sp. AGMB13025]|uniref:MarR family winged helix-turn-helix transcriptional regulator n=1 Tax=Anaerocolumna sp. AGMB13025 TaxID=3039116 RepID=UPI00241C1171|nr:MarR family winged helix-turn-helix transcriptional regulator [Anaerocolumna sp. AGMB13025]WFR58168.1 MarR family winged helix-turn-helix transcriptional regulator [Anaerocolumna sp. AGMB13025]